MLRRCSLSHLARGSIRRDLGNGPPWLLSAKAAADADMLFRPLMTRCCRQWSKLFALRNLYSITSSERFKNDSGIVKPSALAVLRLTTSSNLVGV
jgi:hypothetical protein